MRKVNPTFIKVLLHLASYIPGITIIYWMYADSNLKKAHTLIANHTELGDAISYLLLLTIIIGLGMLVIIKWNKLLQYLGKRFIDSWGRSYLRHERKKVTTEAYGEVRSH